MEQPKKKCEAFFPVSSLFIFAAICRSYLAPCPPVVGLDIQDEMGRHEVGHIDNSMKVPLNQGDGCRFEGEFSINKVRPACASVDLRRSSVAPPRDGSCVRLSGAFKIINPAVAENLGMREAFGSQAPLSFQPSACVRACARSPRVNCQAKCVAGAALNAVPRNHPHVFLTFRPARCRETSTCPRTAPRRSRRAPT